MHDSIRPEGRTYKLVLCIIFDKVNRRCKLELTAHKPCVGLCNPISIGALLSILAEVAVKKSLSINNAQLQGSHFGKDIFIALAHNMHMHVYTHTHTYCKFLLTTFSIEIRQQILSVRSCYNRNVFCL